MIEKGFQDFPGQWWSACKQCKDMLKEEIIRLDSHTCNDFFYRLEDYLHEKIITWARFVEVDISGEMRKLGLVGKLSKAAYEALYSVKDVK